MAPANVSNDMYNRMLNYTENKPRIKKSIGWFFVVFGFFALVTPLTPGGILFFIGLELLGIRFIGIEKIKGLFSKKSVVRPLSEPIALEITSTPTN